MNAEQAKKFLMAKARGEAIIKHYLRILDYQGNVLSETAIELGEDCEVVIINNKEELEEYERENLHRHPINGRD